MTKSPNRLELKHPCGYVLGVAYNDGTGWRFYPKVFGYSVSRKSHPTADKCLPAWAKKRLNQGCSFLPPEPQA